MYYVLISYTSILNIDLKPSLSNSKLIIEGTPFVNCIVETRELDEFQLT